MISNCNFIYYTIDDRMSSRDLVFYPIQFSAVIWKIVNLTLYNVMTRRHMEKPVWTWENKRSKLSADVVVACGKKPRPHQFSERKKIYGKCKQTAQIHPPRRIWRWYYTDVKYLFHLWKFQTENWIKSNSSSTNETKCRYNKLNTTKKKKVKPIRGRCFWWEGLNSFYAG